MVLDLGKALAADAEARSVAEHEVAAQAPADEEADRVAGKRRDPDDRDREHDRRLTLAGDRTAEDDHRLSGNHQPDERSGLEEGEYADQSVGPVTEYPRDFAQQRLEVDLREAARYDGVADDKRDQEHGDNESAPARVLRKLHVGTPSGASPRAIGVAMIGLGSRPESDDADRAHLRLTVGSRSQRARGR